MDNRLGVRLIIGVLAAAALVAVGLYAFNIGVAHGLAESGRLAALPGGEGRHVAFWPGPWAFGFAWFPFFPFVGILLLFLVLRGFFWWGRGGRACGSGRSPAHWDDWHRRAHAAPDQSTPPGTHA